MDLSFLGLSAFAQEATETVAANPASWDSLITNFAPLILVFVIFYLLLIRPQQKRAKEHQKKLESIKKNDEVVTIGGIFAKVIHVRDKEFEVEIAPNVRVKILKSSV